MVGELGFLEEDWAWLRRSVPAFWRSALKHASKRVVWTSSISSNEHSAFLEWISRLGDEPYEFIDMAAIEVDGETKDGRRYRSPALSLGMLSSAAIAAGSLWDQARPLDRDQRNAYFEAWRILKSENAPIRTIDAAGLKSAPLTAFDDTLMAYATNDWRPALYLIGYAMSETFTKDATYFQVGDHVLASRVVSLIEAGRLDCRTPTKAEPFEPNVRFGLTTLARNLEVRRGRS